RTLTLRLGIDDPFLLGAASSTAVLDVPYAAEKGGSIPAPHAINSGGLMGEAVPKSAGPAAVAGAGAKTKGPPRAPPPPPPSAGEPAPAVPPPRPARPARARAGA